MADKYDSNGDYNNYSGSNSSDFKRKSTNDMKEDSQDGENEESSPSSQKAAEYVRELLSEKISLDQGKWPNAARLIDQGGLFLYFDLFHIVYKWRGFRPCCLSMACSIAMFTTNRRT